MSEARFAANVNDMHGLHTVVYDAPAVPDEVWRASQAVLHESVKAGLPQDQWDRAAAIAGINDFEAYRGSRIKPQSLVGGEWNPDQLHRRPLAAFTFDGDEVVAGALATINTSATKEIGLHGKRLHVPKALWPLTYWTKMLVPLGMTLPTPLGREVSGKRHVHLREAYALPGIQAPMESEDPAVIEVSGITLAGLGHLLDEYHPRQEVAMYLKPDDPADTEFVHTARAIGAQDTGKQTKEQRGYEGDELVRAGVSVEEARSRIRELLGSHSDEVASSRLTEKDASYKRWQDSSDARQRGLDG